MTRAISGLVLLILMGGCQSGNITSEASISAGGVANVVIKKVKRNGDAFLVYGELSVKNNFKAIEFVNLKCFSLRNNNLFSNGIYVDSIAHVLQEKYPAKNDKIKADVYWLFEGSIDMKDGFSLIISQPLDTKYSCVTYKS